MHVVHRACVCERDRESVHVRVCVCDISDYTQGGHSGGLKLGANHVDVKIILTDLFLCRSDGRCLHKELGKLLPPQLGGGLAQGQNG